MPTGTGTNVIVGNATLYIAPANTVAPAQASTAGQALWVAPAGTWVYSGFTESGVSFGVNRKVDDIRVEEQSTPVAVINDTTDITIDVTFAEDTIANMVTAYGGGTVTVVAATGVVPGSTTLALSDVLVTVAALFYGINPAGFQRQVYVPNMVASGNIKTEYKRTKTPRMYPVSFAAICPVADITIVDLTAVVT